MALLAKLDRLAIGSILRSKLVFLVNVRLSTALIEGACLGLGSLGISILRQVGSIHSAECVDIDNESNQVP